MPFFFFIPSTSLEMENECVVSPLSHPSYLLSSHWDSSFHSLTAGSEDPRTYKTFDERAMMMTRPYHSRIKSNRFPGNDVLGSREKSPIYCCDKWKPLQPSPTHSIRPCLLGKTRRTEGEVKYPLMDGWMGWSEDIATHA